MHDGGVAAPVIAGTAGIVGGDNVGFTQSAVFTGAGAKNVGNGKAIAVSDVALTGADAGNYTLGRHRRDHAPASRPSRSASTA